MLRFRWKDWDLGPRALAGPLAVVVAATAGWWLFWFETDDAYIAFRYAYNLIHGRGLVWNPPPFHPVDGYTSFLWTVLLAGIWEVTGLKPPDVVNPISLLCGLGTLALTARLVRGIDWPAGAGRWVLPATMVGTLTNRTFLAWLSSGLETAFFDLEVTGWAVAATLGGRWARWTAALTAWATLCALTRPDGLLLVAGTFALVVVRAAREPPNARDLLPLLGFSAVLLLFSWRHEVYGWWLPNTYYAKYLGPWPEAGVRYALSFALEYGLAVPAIAVAVWTARALAGRAELPTPPAVVAIAVLAARFAYYTLIIGGDHFEYRVYAELVPFVPVALAWTASRVRPSATTGALVAWLLASWPIPWVHWWATRSLTTREQTQLLLVPIADEFPWFVRPYVALWDGEQAWLVAHHVCMRHQEHKVFLESQRETLPVRADGARIPWEPDHPVIRKGSVGYLGWVLPNVAIIDGFGLNDRVIAHAGRARYDEDKRKMAHDLEAPAGYIDCFRPNVEIEDRRISITPRELPADEIRRCERLFDPERHR